MNEVVMQNEYALRLKEVSMNERIRELTDKFSAEIEADRAKFDQLLQEKNELEMSAEDNARRTEERHQVLPLCLPHLRYRPHSFSPCESRDATCRDHVSLTLQFSQTCPGCFEHFVHPSTRVARVLMWPHVLTARHFFTCEYATGCYFLLYLSY